MKKIKKDKIKTYDFNEFMLEAGGLGYPGSRGGAAGDHRVPAYSFDDDDTLDWVMSFADDNVLSTGHSVGDMGDHVNRCLDKTWRELGINKAGIKNLLQADDIESNAFYYMIPFALKTEDNGNTELGLNDEVKPFVMEWLKNKSLALDHDQHLKTVSFKPTELEYLALIKINPDMVTTGIDTLQQREQGLTKGNILDCQNTQKVLVKFDEVLTQWENKDINVFEFGVWNNLFTEKFWSLKMDVQHLTRPTFDKVKIEVARLWSVQKKLDD